MKLKFLFSISLCLSIVCVSNKSFAQKVRFANFTNCSIDITAYYSSSCSATGSNFHSFVANEVYEFPAPPAGSGYVHLVMTSGPTVGIVSCGIYNQSEPHSCSGEPTKLFFNIDPSPSSNGTAYHIYQ